MSSAQDPFYIVKEEIQESIDKLQSTFHKWERISPGMGDQVHATKELLANCGSIEWQVDELEKAITVAAKDPALYGIDEAELERRRRWTSNARTQVRNVKTSVLAGKGGFGAGNASEVRLELMRVPNSTEANRYDHYGGRDDDGFVQSESDRQMLLIKQQDEELDELSKSVQRIGGVGLTIHDELVAQERIIDELGTEMDSTKNRLDFVQKKVGMVMKKAGAIVAFTRGLALQLAEKGIRVNGVAPGPIWTPLIPSSFNEEKIKNFGSEVPMKRAGQPIEVAPSYVFLACNHCSSYFTGQVLHPNGGAVVNA